MFNTQVPTSEAFELMERVINFGIAAAIVLGPVPFVALIIFLWRRSKGYGQ